MGESNLIFFLRLHRYSRVKGSNYSLPNSTSIRESRNQAHYSLSHSTDIRKFQDQVHYTLPQLHEHSRVEGSSYSLPVSTSIKSWRIELFSPGLHKLLKVDQAILPVLGLMTPQILSPVQYYFSWSLARGGIIFPSPWPGIFLFWVLGRMTSRSLARHNIYFYGPQPNDPLARCSISFSDPWSKDLRVLSPTRYFFFRSLA